MPNAAPWAVGGAGVLGLSVGVLAVATSPLVPAGALLGLLGLGAALSFPLSAVIGFVLSACLLPFAVVPVRIGFALTLVDICLTLLVIVWLARMLRRREAVVATPIDGLMVLFMGVAVGALILGSGYSAVAGEQFRLFLKLLNSLLFFFVVVQIVRSERDVLWVTRVLIAAGGAAGGIAVGLYLLPRNLTIQLLSALRPLGYPSGPEVIRTIASTETVRATGTSIDPNVLGGLLMVVGVLACAALLAPRSILPRPLLLGLLACILGGVALSYSRSSWIGLAAGVGFIAGFRDRRAWLLVGLGVAALALVPQGQVLVERFSSGLAARDQAAAMRVAEYEDALTLITQYPVLGVGFGQAPSIELYVAVSSIYLLIAEEMGLVGLVLFCAMLAVTLVWSFRRLAPTGSMLSSVGIGLQGAVVAALVAGLFDHYFFNIRFPHMVALFWLLVGLLMVTVRLEGAAGSTAMAREDPWRALTPTMRSAD